MKGKFIFSNVKTRQDYEVLNDTDKILFKTILKGTIEKQRDVQEYPTGYLELEESEQTLEPVLEDYEDLRIIERFGFTKDDVW